MFICKIQNTQNNILTLTQNETNYQLLSVEGTNPPQAQINLSKVAGQDGSRFNSSTLNERNLVLTIKLNGDVEKNRIYLYSFFRIKKWCKLYYKNGMRDVFIEGYIEAVNVNPFSNNEIMQISIICPNPYFKGIDIIIDDVSKVTKAFDFPFGININDPIEISTLDTEKITNVYNNSEIETGVVMELEILYDCSKIQINNIMTAETFILNYKFLENDIVTIDTNKGNKSVVLLRNGVVTNLFTAISKNSTFFELAVGDNFFSYLVDNGTNDGAVNIIFKHYLLYGGV